MKGETKQTIEQLRHEVAALRVASNSKYGSGVIALPKVRPDNMLPEQYYLWKIKNDLVWVVWLNSDGDGVELVDGDGSNWYFGDGLEGDFFGPVEFGVTP